MSQSVWGEKETQFFYQLTPEKILNAVETTGLVCTGRCIPLNSMENRVFEVELDIEDPKKLKSRFEQYKIIKFYRPGRWTKEQILEEHEFLKDLSENDVPVAKPISLIDNQTIGKLDDIDIFYSIFDKVGGRSPEEMTEEQIQITGRLLARLHNVGATKIAKHRLSINPITYGLENLRYLIDQNIIPMELKTRYQKAVESICKKSELLFANTKKIRLHGDCHLGNLIWSDKGPFWVDFDDMVTGPAIQDIWLVIPGRDEFAIQQRQLLIEAYSMMRSFENESINLIEPLRSLRFVHFCAWITKRRKDPAFIRAFPNFNSIEYWNEQVADIEEQERLVQLIF